MYSVAVDTGCKGRGIGKALIAVAEAEVARCGYGEIRFYTHETTVENIRIYAKLTYEETECAEQEG